MLETPVPGGFSEVPPFGRQTWPCRFRAQCPFDHIAEGRANQKALPSYAVVAKVTVAKLHKLNRLPQLFRLGKPVSHVTIVKRQLWTIGQPAVYNPTGRLANPRKPVKERCDATQDDVSDLIFCVSAFLYVATTYAADSQAASGGRPRSPRRDVVAACEHAKADFHPITESDVAQAKDGPGGSPRPARREADGGGSQRGGLAKVSPLGRAAGLASRGQEARI